MPFDGSSSNKFAILQNSPQCSSCFIIFFSAKERDFIRPLSPVKKSKKPIKNLKHCKESKAPVQLKNLVVTEHKDWIFNQEAVAHQAATSDITLNYVEQQKSASVSNSTTK